MPPEEERPVLKAEGLTKRYGKRPALTDCNLSVPRGRVAGLVGPNGAGKSTLLQLSCGLIEPSEGVLEVLGGKPGTTAEHVAKVGFVAQDTPVYAGLTVGEHLRMGAKLNPRWDPALAGRRIARAGLKLDQKAGRLSGGQRAQLALTVAAAKRPELLIFDEPAAALDPLARSDFLRNLMEFVAELDAAAILSSHLLADVERVCDYLIVLCDSRVQVAGDVRDLLASHFRVVAPRGELDGWLPGAEIIWARPDGRESQAVVRVTGPLTGVPGRTSEIALEDLVLAYLNRAAGVAAGRSVATAGEARR